MTIAVSRTCGRGGGLELQQRVGGAVDEDAAAEVPNGKILCAEILIESSGGRNSTLIQSVAEINYPKQGLYSKACVRILESKVTHDQRTMDSK